MARQEQLFHSLRRFNSYVLTLVTFISEVAQEIYYYNARREVRKRLQLFSWYFKMGTKIEMWTLCWRPEEYSIAPVKKTKPKETKKKYMNIWITYLGFRIIGWTLSIHQATRNEAKLQPVWKCPLKTIFVDTPQHLGILITCSDPTIFDPVQTWNKGILSSWKKFTFPFWAKGGSRFYNEAEVLMFVFLLTKQPNPFLFSRDWHLRSISKIKVLK